jgi:hypothetical protein
MYDVNYISIPLNGHSFFLHPFWEISNRQNLHPSEQNSCQNFHPVIGETINKKIWIAYVQKIIYCDSRGEKINHCVPPTTSDHCVLFLKEGITDDY